MWPHNEDLLDLGNPLVSNEPEQESPLKIQGHATDTKILFPRTEPTTLYDGMVKREKKAQ